MNIYNEIQNPINNDETLKKIIKIYAECEEQNKIFYNSIVTATTKEKKYKAKMNVEDQHELISMLFNTWKENIVKLTPQKFQKIYGHKGNFNDKDFIELQNYLSCISDISTQKEFESIMHEKHGNELLDKAIKKYTFELVQSGLWDRFFYIDSYKLAERPRSPVTHRLYVNTNSVLLRPLLREMFKEFQKRQMDYSLKYDDSGARDDTIVIYANDENLQDYIEILRKLYEDIQEVRKRTTEDVEVFDIHKPPLMTGVIDGWIGYGTEPEVDENGNNRSYNGVRKEIIKEAISKSTSQWLYENRDMVLSSEPEEFKISDLLFNKIGSSYLKKVKGILELKKKQNKLKPFEYDRNELIEVISDYINQELLDINEETNYNPEFIDYDFGNNINVEFGRKDVKRIFNSLSVQILNWDSQFLDRVRNKVKELSPKYNIDEKSFCCDTRVVNSLKHLKSQESTIGSNKITLSDCIDKIKGLDPEKLSDAYRIIELLELGEIDINKMEEEQIVY